MCVFVQKKCLITTVAARYTFTTFSHMKSVLVRDFSKLGEYLGETR